MTPTVVHTTGLSKSFGASRALVGLSLEVAQGEVLGYLAGQRCRQDHDDPLVARVYPADVGLGRGLRP